MDDLTEKFTYELEINDKFKNLIPPLTADELRILEENILEHGVRDPILIWNNVIIDGHNRYEICKKHNLPFIVKELEFNNELEALIYIIRNQLGRRNLTDFAKTNLSLELEETTSKIAKQNKILGNQIGAALTNNKLHGKELNNERSLANLPTSVSHINTREEIAKLAGVGERTVSKVKKINANAVDEIKQELMKPDGKLTINTAEIISQLPAEEQKEIIQKLDEKAIIKRAKEIKEARKNNTKLLQKQQQYISSLNSDVSDNRPVIYIADCRDYLQTLNDEEFDLLITDPPYSTDVDNIVDFANSWVLPALEKVKSTGRAFIFIGAYPIEIKAYLDILLNQDKFILDSPLVWTYKNTHLLPPKSKYNLNYQAILHLYTEDSKPLNHNNITSETFAVQEFNAPDGRLGNRFHAWQKPMQLAEQLIRQTTEPNAKVLDLFACTGTFLVAAAKLGRQAVGCEINEENAKIAETLGCRIEFPK
jgi:DNA modification methylase